MEITLQKISASWWALVKPKINFKKSYSGVKFFALFEFRVINRGSFLKNGLKANRARNNNFDPLLSVLSKLLQKTKNLWSELSFRSGHFRTSYLTGLIKIYHPVYWNQFYKVCSFLKKNQGSNCF